MDSGTIISGTAHGLLLAWLAVGGLFARVPDEPLFESADVQLISSEEFAALTRPEAAPEVETDVAEPPAPELDVSPVPEIRPPDPPPEPPAPEVVETPPPLPEPLEPVTQEAPPEIVPPAPEPEPPVEAPLAEETTPEEAPRVAPVPVPDTPETPDIAETPTPTVDPDANTDAVPEELPEAAPEQATTEIVTEAEKPSRAPETSIAPPARPVFETAAATPPPAETPATVTPPATDPLAAAVAGAVADALASPVAPPGRPAGPPLSFGEKENFRVAVAACWNRGAVSTAAERTTVVVGFSMNQDGTPDASTIRMLSASGGDDTAARTAFEAASRAIRRCGARGFGLPKEKYAHWQQVEIVFRASGPTIQ